MGGKYLTLQSCHFSKQRMTSEMTVFPYSLDRNFFNIYYNCEALLLARKQPSFTPGFDKLREMNPSISRILGQTSGREVNLRHRLH